MTDLVRVVLAVLATYRLAELLIYDEGPWDLSERFREWARLHPNNLIRGGLGGVFSCVFCIGLWIALLAAVAILFPTVIGDAILLVLGIAGGQYLLAYWTGSDDDG